MQSIRYKQKIEQQAICPKAMQLQKVSVTLRFRRLQCLVLRSVLSVFSTCVLQSVCVHTMDFVSGINKQINK